MNLSIRNQIPGTVIDIVAGGVMAVVKARLDGGQEITAAITREAAEELGLARNLPVRALIKSTEVSLSTSPVHGVTIRNQIPGTVSRLTRGEAMTAVNVTVDGGELTAAVTTESVTELALRVGTPVVALVKSTEVSLAAG